MLEDIAVEVAVLAVGVGGLHNSLITKKVMTHQSCKIGCVYKTPICKSGHKYKQIRSQIKISCVWVCAHV